MSNHQRTAIRNAIAARLSTPAEGVYPTPCEANVFVNRNLPVFPAQLPALLIYVESDAPVRKLMSAKYRAWHDLGVVIEAAVKDADLDDNLDLISQAVEEQLMGSPNLGLDDVQSIQMGETSITTRSQPEGAEALGSIRTVFLVRYLRTTEEAGAAGQPILEEIHDHFGLDEMPTDKTYDTKAVAELPGVEE